jgi:uncharacterized membrane protein YhaH (DUF805 family)
MELWAWIAVVVIIAAIFLFITGEALVTIFLTCFWVGAIYLLVEHGGSLMDAVWPAMLIVLGLVVLSIVTLAVLASAMEDRRFKDRGRPAPPG